MKRLFFLFLFFNGFLFSDLFSQTFQRSYDFCDGDLNTTDARGEYVAEIEDGYLVFAENFFSCFSVIKLNFDGEVVEVKEFEFGSQFVQSKFSGLLELKSGDFLILGRTHFNIIDTDVFLMKISRETLDTLWTKRYYLDDYQFPSSIKQIDENKFAILTETDSLNIRPGQLPSVAKNDFLFLEIDTAGNLLDTFLLAGDTGLSINVGDFHPLPNGEKILVYRTDEVIENFQGWRCLLNSNYQRVWCDTISTMLRDIIPMPQVTVSLDSSIIYAGWIRERPFFHRTRAQNSMVVQAFTHENDLFWETELWFGDNSLTSLKVSESGDIYGCGGGIGRIVETGDFAGRIFKLNPFGTPQFFRMIKLDPLLPEHDFDDNTSLWDITPTSDGGILSTGRIDPPNTNTDGDKADIFVVKFNESGCLAPSCDSGVIDLLTILPAENKVNNSLVQIYPNPTSETINITFNPSLGKVNFSLFSLTGKKVLQKNELWSGSRINIADFPKGIYFYQLQSADNQRVGSGRVVVQ